MIGVPPFVAGAFQLNATLELLPVAELSVGDDRYLLDRDQLDYLIHVLIRMRRTIRQYDEREEHPGG